MYKESKLCNWGSGCCLCRAQNEHAWRDASLWLQTLGGSCRPLVLSPGEVRPCNHLAWPMSPQQHNGSSLGCMVTFMGPRPFCPWGIFPADKNTPTDVSLLHWCKHEYVTWKDFLWYDSLIFSPSFRRNRDIILGLPPYFSGSQKQLHKFACSSTHAQVLPPSPWHTDMVNAGGLC